MSKSKQKKLKAPDTGHTITLHFDSQMMLDWFKAQWLDGGLEQHMNMVSTDKWGDDWMYLETNPDSCPKCGYLSNDFYDTAHELNEVVTCPNCSRKYRLKG